MKTVATWKKFADLSRVNAATGFVFVNKSTEQLEDFDNKRYYDK